MRLIHKLLLNGEEINSEYLFQLLQQSNLKIFKLFSHKILELRNEYFEMRDIF